MKALFDFFPLILFFVATKFADIYVATAVAIAATFVQVGYVWLTTRRFETTHLITLGVITLFGGMTLFFHNDTFIKWKPSVVNWLFSAIIFGAMLLNKSVMKAMMGGQISLPDKVWKGMNLAWGTFFLLMGFLNMYVAFYYQLDASDEQRLETWINFKVFWMLGLTFAFSILQMLFISKHIDPEEMESLQAKAQEKKSQKDKIKISKEE